MRTFHLLVTVPKNYHVSQNGDVENTEERSILVLHVSIEGVVRCVSISKFLSVGTQ